VHDGESLGQLGIVRRFENLGRGFAFRARRTMRPKPDFLAAFDGGVLTA
jgi:hypothetical protein